MRLPFRLRLLLIALVISIGLCLVAAWLTSGSFDPRGGKSTFVAALIVVPLAVASKYGITGAAAMFLAFLFYWLASFALLAFPWRGRGSGH